MSHALLAIQNILQNSNIFIGSRETVLFMPFGKKKVTQFSGLSPTLVSYLNDELNYALQDDNEEIFGDQSENTVNVNLAEDTIIKPGIK